MREYTVKNQDFTKFEQNEGLILTKVDRNNTHYYTNTCCPKGTIKDHSEYKFVKQTELTRCKVSRA